MVFRRVVAIMCASSLGLLSSCTKNKVESKTKDTTIKVDQKAVYFITPWKEAVVSERAQAVEDAVTLVQAGVKKLYSDQGLSRRAGESIGAQINPESLEKFLDMEDLTSNVFEKTLIRAERHMQLGADRIADIGISIVDIVPTAIMFIVGGGATLKHRVGGGGGVHIAFILMPAKVTRIDKITGEKTARWKFLVSMSGIIQGDIGTGVAASGGPTAGFGLIWGSLNHPSSFRGAAVGPHGKIQQGFGVNWKVMALKRNFRDYSIDNIFATFVWGAGAGAEVGITGNAIIPMEGLVKLMFGGGDSVDGPSRSVVDEIERVKETENDLKDALEKADSDDSADEATDGTTNTDGTPDTAAETIANSPIAGAQ